MRPPMIDTQPADAPQNSRDAGFPLVAVIFLILAVLLVPFFPLLAAAIEDALFGTDRVEDFCKMIGIHDELSQLYKLVFALIK
jgi:hypothetical protein